MVTAAPPQDHEAAHLAAPPSPAGPIDADELAGLPEPPWLQEPRALQVLRFNRRQHAVVSRGRRAHGDVFRMRSVIPGSVAITSHPDHARSLFTAKPSDVPTLTAESPLRPIVGPGSVLTAQGARHMRQRRLLLPPFHGEAIARYAESIEAAAERELSRWRVGEELALAPRMQAITLDVILAAVFGIDERSGRGTPERRLRDATRRILDASTSRLAPLGELANLGHEEPVGLTRLGLSFLDRAAYRIIAERRRDAALAERRDILSLLLQARTEEGEALTDREVRDELLTLVLAGHETTANQLAWTWERLVRSPDALGRLVAAVRGEGSGDAEDEVERVLTESMRSRPVIPVVGRRVARPWRLGEHGVPAATPVSVSVFLIHHREDLYPEPLAFRPERWCDRRPGTYTWLPFGGGTRRCLGAALAMAEMRVVLRAMARTLDLAAVERAPERPRHRNVTMIPGDGARVRVLARRA